MGRGEGEKRKQVSLLSPETPDTQAKRQVDWEILKAFSAILSIIAVIVASLVAVCYL